MSGTAHREYDPNFTYERRSNLRRVGFRLFNEETNEEYSYLYRDLEDDEGRVIFTIGRANSRDLILKPDASLGERFKISRVHAILESSDEWDAGLLDIYSMSKRGTTFIQHRKTGTQVALTRGKSALLSDGDTVVLGSGSSIHASFVFRYRYG